MALTEDMSIAIDSVDIYRREPRSTFDADPLLNAHRYSNFHRQHGAHHISRLNAIYLIYILTARLVKWVKTTRTYLRPIPLIFHFRHHFL